MASHPALRGMSGPPPLGAGEEDRASFELTEEELEAVRLRFQAGAGGGLGQFQQQRPSAVGGSAVDPDFQRWKVRTAA